jgi:hypothetical protein
MKEVASDCLRGIALDGQLRAIRGKEAHNLSGLNIRSGKVMIFRKLGAREWLPGHLFRVGGSKAPGLKGKCPLTKGALRGLW